MKICRIIIAIFLAFCIGFTIIFYGKTFEKDDKFEKNTYKGVITLWNIDSFEGGTWSRREFLLDVAKKFEKENSGVLIMVVNQTVLSAEENFNKGIYPDMISYSNGLNIDNFKVLDISDGYFARIKNEIIGVSWARGGYVLFSKTEIQENKKKLSKIVVSKKDYTNPLVALTLNDYSSDRVIIKEPLEAYLSFVGDEKSCFLGTQRDIIRLNNRKTEFYCKPLSGFSDLRQYISIINSEKEKEKYSAKFIEFLLSEEIQQSLYKIGLFSEKYKVKYDDENMQNMQNVTVNNTIPVYFSKEKIKEVFTLSQKAVTGNESEKYNLKNFLFIS